MKQMACGAMAALALVVLTGCVKDPQEQINDDNFNTLQAYPEVAFLKAGVVGGTTDSSAVYFRLINDFARRHCRGVVRANVIQQMQGFLRAFRTRGQQV